MRGLVERAADHPRGRPRLAHALTISRCKVRTRRSFTGEAQKLERLIAQLPAGAGRELRDLQIKMPRVRIEVDRDKAAALQLNVAQIQRTLYDAFGPQWASTIYAPTNQYKVLLEMLPKYQSSTDYLSMIYFKSTRRSPGAAGRRGHARRPMPARRPSTIPASCRP